MYFFSKVGCTLLQWKAKYQGVPVGGYNKLIDRLLECVDTMFSVDFFKDRAKWETIADEIVYTGRID